MNNFFTADSFNIRDYIEIAFQRKWFFIIPFLSIFLVVILGSLFLPRIYLATVCIEVLPNTITRAFDVSTNLKHQITILNQRMLSQMYLQNLIEKERLSKSNDSLAIQRTIDELRENIKIKMINDSLVHISYQGKDRIKVARIARIIAQDFIKESFKTSDEETNNAINFLKSQLELYKKKMEKAEEKTYLPNPLVKRLREKLIKLEEELAELLINAKEDHPRAVELKNAIEETKEELKKATQGKELEEQMLEEVRLERERRLNESLYGQLLNKLEAARISQRLKSEEEKTRFRIIDFYIRQIAPNYKKIISSGIFLGILLGLGMVLLIEYVDHSFKDVEDLRTYLNLNVLGSIPMVSGEPERKEKYE